MARTGKWGDPPAWRMFQGPLSTFSFLFPFRPKGTDEEKVKGVRVASLGNA